MSFMLLEYPEDDDCHEIFPVTSLLSGDKKKIGSRITYRHPLYGTSFERILIHIGSERNCREYEQKLIDKRRNGDKGNTVVTNLRIEKGKAASKHTVAENRLLRPIKVEPKSPRSGKGYSRKDKGVKERKAVIPNYHRSRMGSGTPFSNESSPNIPSNHSSPLRMPPHHRSTVSRDSHQNAHRDHGDTNSEAIEILRYLKANVPAQTHHPVRYSGIDFLPKEDVIEISEEHPEDTSFVRVLLDTIFSEDEKKLPLSERDPLKMKWVKEQFRVLKSPEPKDFIRRWKETLRRYRFNVTRRNKGGYTSIIQSQIDD